MHIGVSFFVFKGKNVLAFGRSLFWMLRRDVISLLNTTATFSHLSCFSRRSQYNQARQGDSSSWVFRHNLTRFEREVEMTMIETQLSETKQMELV